MSSRSTHAFLRIFGRERSPKVFIEILVLGGAGAGI